MKDGWSQRKRGRWERECGRCHRIFYCSGACSHEGRRRLKFACWCPECALEELKILRIVREDIPAYRGLTSEEIYRRCYGREARVESANTQ